MTETRKTLIFGAAAVVLVLIAFVTTPKQVTLDAFFDQGEQFFPDFTDPNSARTLEVIDWDDETGSAIPFKVTFQDGRWTIPSHHGYPADGADRLAGTAAGVIGISKDDFRTDNVADHEACGVIDPVDDTNPSLKGRGKRVTIKGENDVVLADLIIGRAFEGRENFRLVRIPGQKRVYAASIEIDISTAFSDWIEADLMLIEQGEIDKVVSKNYSIDESTGRLNPGEDLALGRLDESTWAANGMADNQEVDSYKMNNLLKAVDELSIEGVRPKPAGLTASLSKASEGMSITQSDMLSLQSKGFYFATDGRLVSNEGELHVQTADGVIYMMRFGEVAFGSGLELTAGSSESEQPGGGKPGENRYLMIMTSFDASQFPEPERPADTSFTTKPDSLWTEEDYRMKGVQTAWDSWSERVASGQERSLKMNDRFAGWYYVISSASFDGLRMTREDIVKDKPES